MTAVRIVESSGSRGSLQISDGSGGFIFTDSLFFDFAQNTLIASGSSESPTTVNSGSAQFLQGMSGSLTQLPDGRSYLVAGSNVTITSESNGQVTISSTGGGGGSISVNSGSTTVSSVSTIAASNGFILNDEGGGRAALTASIGLAEDGDYTDGLFVDFTPQTLLGTAIDRFNEILKALAPSPAPRLDDIDVADSGITSFLSFGSSNDQTLATPSYTTVGNSAGIGSAVDVNESYAPATSGNNERIGIFAGLTTINGVLNQDVTSNSQGGGYVNYPADSFGDADQGTLKLEVNGSVVKSIDLTDLSVGAGGSGLGTDNQVNANGSGFVNLSAATTGTFSNGNAFNTFKHRTGEYTIDPDDQRNGWNYARIVHTIGSTDTVTNYIEWVNDDNADALAAAGNEITFEGSGSIHLSGVEYFRSGSAEYKVRVTNAYKYIYDNTAISFPTSNTATLSSSPSFSISNQAKPTINTAGGEDHTKVLHLTGSSAITANYFINGSVTAGVSVTHPRKSNLSNSGQATASGILMYNLTNTSTNTLETFRRENYRIVSGAYDTQASVVDAGNVWNSTVFITASNGGHSNGLQFYNSRLYAPTNTLNSGDFRDNSDGGSLNNAPSENPDYSGQTSGQRTFYRWFQNLDGVTHYDLSIAINGSSTIVPNTTALNSSRIRVFVKIPEVTGWMDAALPFTIDQYQDNDGAYTISFDNSLNATNYLNFGNVGVANNNYVVLRIEADSSWTGYVDQITVNIGAGTGTLTPVPDLDNIDADNTGITANLSFGSSKSISGYSDVGTTAGFSAVDVNGLYEAPSGGTDYRRGIFNGSAIFEGDLNEDVVSPGYDYANNAFSDANTGSLKLEVNGSVIYELEITGSEGLVGSGAPGAGTDDSNVNANGSGFIDLSEWAPGRFDNQVPRYSEVQRTSKYRIVAADQRNGWNYARVIHTVNGIDRETNYVEWVNDNDANALSSAGNNLTIFGDDSFNYLSGVKYFSSPSGSIETRISNIYKNVYSDSASAISFTSLTNATGAKIVQEGTGLSSTKTTVSSTDSLQTLNTNPDSQNEVLNVTGTINFTRSKSLPGTYTTAYSCAGAMTFVHPLKSNHTISTQTTTNLLVWTPSDTSNANTDEFFTGESYRLVSASYGSQLDVSGGSNNWNSQTSMNDQATYPEHATGLLIYDTYLIPPKDGGNNGDFRNHDEGGGIESPAGNVNYSSLTNSERHYYRSYLNNTTADRPSITITAYGDATLVGKTGANAASLGSNKNIFIEAKIPGKSGWLDLAKPSAGAGNTSDGDGCLSGDLNSSIGSGGTSNICTFNGLTVDGTVSGAEYFVIKVSASENWTGYLTRLTVAWSV